MTPRTLLAMGIATSLLLQGEVTAQNENVPVPIPKPIRRFGLGDIRCLTMAPTHQWLATGGQAGAFLWEIDDPAQIHRLDVPWSASALAFSPEGNILYVASQGEILAFDTTTRAVRKRMTGHTAEISRLGLAPDGTALGSASVDNTLRIWSSSSGEPQISLRIEGSPILDFAFAPDGQTLATVDTFLTNSVRFWSRATGALLRALPTTNAFIQRCIYTPEGQLITLGADRILSLWNPEKGQAIRTFAGITNPTTFIHDVWLSDESTVAAIANDGRVRLWNLQTAELLREVPGGPSIAAAGVTGEPLVLTADIDSVVHLRQLSGGDSLRRFIGHTSSTHSGVAFSPDGRFVLSGGVERAIRLWDRQSGLLVRSFNGSPAGTATTGFSSDGTQVYGTLGLPEPGVRLWNSASGEVIRDYRWNSSWPTSAALSHDGARVAAGAQDQVVRIYDGATATLLRSHRIAGLESPSRLAFAPTQPWLAVGSTGSSVTLLNHETGDILKTLVSNAGPVTSLQFTSSSRRLLVAWQDGLARLYETTSFNILREFITQNGFLDASVISPDESTILTGESFPGFTATVWDVTTGKVLRTLAEHRWSVAALAFSDDGQAVLTGSDVVREWSIADLSPRIGITRIATQAEVTWNRGMLERAYNANGPWKTVADASSPLTMSTEDGDVGPTVFFRVRTSP